VPVLFAPFFIPLQKNHGTVFGKKELIARKEQDKIVACIAAAEKQTTGEIRVYVESHCAGDPLLRCEELFPAMEMHNTRARNGVLIYLALKDQKFAIAGDEGIHRKAGGNSYWETVAVELKQFLSRGMITDGVCHCVTAVGKLLAVHFPPDGTETDNELPDDIVFGK
jgi:uncharacterized membrane protein